MKHFDAYALIVQNNKDTGFCVFSKPDLGSLFRMWGQDLDDVISSLIDEELLTHLADDVYVGSKLDGYHNEEVTYEIIKKLRRGHYNYMSFASALSEYGVRSQWAPVKTIATTGESGRYDTPCGRFDFIHVEHSVSHILAHTHMDPRGIRYANVRHAYNDAMTFGGWYLNDSYEWDMELLEDLEAEEV